MVTSALSSAASLFSAAKPQDPAGNAAAGAPDGGPPDDTAADDTDAPQDPSASTYEPAGFSSGGALRTSATTPAIPTVPMVPVAPDPTAPATTLVPPAAALPFGVSLTTSTSGVAGRITGADGGFSVGASIAGIGTPTTRIDADARIQLGTATLDAAVRAQFGGTLDGTFMARVNIGTTEGPVWWDVLVGYASVPDIRGRQNADGVDGLGYDTTQTNWGQSGLVLGGGIGFNVATDLDPARVWSLAASGDLRALVYLPLWPADSRAAEQNLRNTNGQQAMDSGTAFGLSGANLTTGISLTGNLPEGTIRLGLSAVSGSEDTAFRALRDGFGGVLSFLVANPALSASFTSADGSVRVGGELPLNGTGVGASVSVNVQDASGLQLAATGTNTANGLALSASAQVPLSSTVTAVGQVNANSQSTTVGVGLRIGVPTGAALPTLPTSPANPLPARQIAGITNNALDVTAARRCATLAQASALLRTPEQISSFINTNTGNGSLSYIAGADVLQQQQDAWDPTGETTFKAGGGVCVNLHNVATLLLQRAGYEAYTIAFAAPAISHAITTYRDPKTGGWNILQYGKCYPTNAKTPFDALQQVFPDALVGSVIDPSNGRVVQRGSSGLAADFREFFWPLPKRP